MARKTTDTSRIFHAASLETPERCIPHEVDECGENPIEVAETDEICTIQNASQDVDFLDVFDEDPNEVRIEISGSPEAVATFLRSLARLEKGESLS